MNVTLAGTERNADALFVDILQVKRKDAFLQLLQRLDWIQARSGPVARIATGADPSAPALEVFQQLVGAANGGAGLAWLWIAT